MRGERKIKSVPNGYSITVRGVVQGVGFRPFVYRLARTNNLKGWVSNTERGVAIHVEGDEAPLVLFLAELKAHPPRAADISEIRVEPANADRFADFTIRESTGEWRPTVRISPDWG